MKPVEKKLDRTDRRILHILQNEGRISNVDLSARVSLSPAPCLARVKKLEAEGYIKGYAAELDSHKLGLSLLVYIEITLDRTTPDVFAKFRQEVGRIPEIEECQMLAGGFDYLIKVRCSDMGSYRKLLGEKITAITGISQTHTYVVMEEIKSSRALHF